MKIYLFVLFFLPMAGFAQKINHTSSLAEMSRDHYFRVNYDNDYFASDDRDFTQGYNFELVTPWLKKNPANVLFVAAENSISKYGVSIEHIGFTPNNIKTPEIQVGDRPFAAAIVLKSFKVSIDTIGHSRVNSSLSIGIIGPGAFGKEMQDAIHKVSGNPIPKGWKNQIKNDVVLNYEIGYEKQLFRYNDIFMFSANGNAKLGTLFTNVSAGVTSAIGILNRPFSVFSAKKTFSLYVYYQPIATAVGYDATLQGGWFNDKSPYTIASDQLKRFTAQHNYGIVLQTKTLYFEYSRTNSTREFDSGVAARWGGIRIGFTF